MNENEKIINDFLCSRKLSANSLKAYKNGLRNYMEFCAVNNIVDMFDEHSYYQYIASFKNTNLNTVFLRQQIVRAFLHWKTGKRIKKVVSQTSRHQKYNKMEKIMSVIRCPISNVKSFKNIRAHTMCLLLTYTNLDLEDIVNLPSDILFEFSLLDNCINKYRKMGKDSAYLFYNVRSCEKIKPQAINVCIKEYTGCDPIDFKCLINERYKIAKPIA